MKQPLYIGGYTKRLNKGIHEVLFNSDKRKIEESHLISAIDNPTYLCLNKDKNLIFSLIQDKENSGIIALKKTDSVWKEDARFVKNNINGCHITYNEAFNTLYVSNYHEGIIDIYHYEDSKIELLQTLHYKENSRIHFTSFSADNKHLFACDLGTDTILSYSVNSDGTLSLIFENKMHDEMGPRHFVLHPSLPLMYVIGEYDNAITLCQINDGYQLAELETYPNIPNELKDGASGAAIKMTHSGDYLYTSTRFSNFISVFSIDEIGRLNRIQYIDSVGQIPRDFTFSDDETFILVPHQDSDFISIFKRDPSSGLLTFVNNDTEIPESVCII